jgi:site-specific DNA-cytosine methylase
MRRVNLKHFHLFGGVGGAALGGRHLTVSAAGLSAGFRCLGGVDVDHGAMRAFSRLTGAPGTVLDLFSVEQYRAFHGAPPPAGWREATADDLRSAAGGESPDILVTSPPCKGFSGLISESKSASARYQALNGLTLRGVELALEAWRDEPPGFWLLENVPRLLTRGEWLLGEIVQRLEAAGYSVSWTVPDLGELGGLAQTRKRLHLVARHRARVPVHVFEPPRRSLRPVGDVLGRLPVPLGDHGPLHQVARLEWRTWVRLALIPAGQDWRALQSLAVEGGRLRDYCLAGTWHNGALGIVPWSSPAGTVTGEGRPQNGAFSVADPRLEAPRFSNAAAVLEWSRPCRTLTGSLSPSEGGFAIADPRMPGLEPSQADRRAHDFYGILGWEETGRTVTGAASHNNGRWSIADPRPAYQGEYGQLRVMPWEGPASTVTSRGTPGEGPMAISDPRIEGVRHNNVLRVARWDEASPAVTAGSTPTSGGVCIADPRARGVAVILALDGTWHRPMTVLERAALQGLLEGDDGRAEFEAATAGVSSTRVSEWVGNAIPPPAMAATLRAAGVALLLARAGETFALGATPVWCRPLARGVLAGGGA